MVTQLKLNQQFSSDQVQFVEGEQGFTKVLINNAFARCEIYLHGAHVTSFIPQGQDDLLWLSPAVMFVAGKSIRGGIPICWPWFGAHPSDSSKGAHGFARLVDWQVESVQTNDDGATELTFALNHSDATLALWPFKFALRYKVVVGEKLTVSLTTRNIDASELQLSEALHSYFAVADTNRSSLQGLDGVSYLDTVGGRTKRTQAGDITIDQEVDRIYFNTQDTCLLLDDEKRSTVRIAKSGSNSTIVWNPWIDKAHSMPDVSDSGYLNFICVETANAFDNLVTVAAGESHTVSQTIHQTIHQTSGLN